VLKPPRRLGPDEVEQLLARDVPAHPATLDAEGFPHITPLWFVWTDGSFHMTSIAGATWTTHITEKYLRGPGVSQQVRARGGDERVVICLRPARLIAVASV
jgi:hypothetical protein